MLILAHMPWKGGPPHKLGVCGLLALQVIANRQIMITREKKHYVSTGGCYQSRYWLDNCG